MRYEYIEPFVLSTMKVIDTVMQSDISMGKVSLLRSSEIDGDLAILIRLRGYSDGCIILNMKTETAMKICNVMLDGSFETLMPIGMDSIAELANMIAGNAISVINDLGYEFMIDPPLIVLRDRIRDETPDIEVFQIPLFTECGEIVMNIALGTN
jgi:chemotaxis protein CheX